MTQPEHKLATKVMDFLRHKGAWVFKVHGGPMQPSGIPDIVGVYWGQFIAVECKMPGNSLSEIQKFRIRKIRAAGGLVVVAYSLGDVQQFILHLNNHHSLPGNTISDANHCWAPICPWGQKAPNENS